LAKDQGGSKDYPIRGILVREEKGAEKISGEAWLIFNSKQASSAEDNRVPTIVTQYGTRQIQG
jgi:hypothetical protein